MSTSATISPTASQQSPVSSKLPSMSVANSDAMRTTSNSRGKLPNKVRMTIENLPGRPSPYQRAPFQIDYWSNQQKKWVSFSRSVELTRTQIGGTAFPKIRITNTQSQKIIIIDGNNNRPNVNGAKVSTGADGVRTITIPGRTRQDPPIIIKQKPFFSSNSSVPTSKPAVVRGNNKDDGNWGDVYGVTYKKDGKGNVIIEGYARLESLLIYDRKAKRWVYVKDHTNEDKDGKDNGIIRFRISVKAGDSVSLFAVAKDSKGNPIAGKRVATLYTTANPKKNNSDGAVVIAAAAAGIAAGAGAAKGAIAIGAAGLGTVAGAAAASGARNPSKPNPEVPTLLQMLTTALRPIEQRLMRSRSLNDAAELIEQTPALRRVMSAPNLNVSPSNPRPTAAQTAQMQDDVVNFSTTLGPVLRQLFNALFAGGVTAIISDLISGIIPGKVLNGGRPATISIFTHTHLKKWEGGPNFGAMGPGPYFGFSPANTTVSNTQFTVSFATPTKLKINGREWGLGISLAWAIDTAEKNDTGSVGNKESFVLGMFGYGLGGKLPENPVNPPRDRPRNAKNFYIGLESDFGVQVRWRPGREHENQFIMAGWLNLLATVAAKHNAAKNAPVLLFGPLTSPAKLQWILKNHLPKDSRHPRPGPIQDPPNTGTSPKPNPDKEPKPGPTRQLRALMSGFDDKFWMSQDRRADKTVRDLLKGVTLANTRTDKKHYVSDGAKPRKGKREPGVNFDYDTGKGKKDPNGVTMKYRGGTNGIQHPNEVIFHLGNGLKIHVRFDNLWNTKAKKGSDPKVLKIFGRDKNDRLVHTDWIKKNLNARFANGTVILTNLSKSYPGAPPSKGFR